MDQFRANLGETLAVFQRHKVPVFVSTLVSNTRDLRPFVSFAVDRRKYPHFDEAFGAAVKALKENDYRKAYRYLQTADSIFDGHALTKFYLGRLAYRYGDYEKARQCFIHAKDLDGLRFRAPEAANDIIREVGRQYGARVVDAQAVFEKASPHGIIGDALLLEHVHPNLTGYGLLSDAFYEALKAEHVFDVDNHTEMTAVQLLRTMPITRVDSLAGLYKIDRLKNSWPFRGALHRDDIKLNTYEGKLAKRLADRHMPWQEAMDSLYAHYIGQRQLRAAKTVMEALVLEYPDDPAFYEKAAMLSGELNAMDDALVYFQNAFRRGPNAERARYLMVIYLKQDRPAEALPYLDYVIAHSPSRAGLLAVKNYTEKIIKLQAIQKNDTANVALLNEIAHAYFSMDNRDATKKYVRKVIALDAHNAPALALQSKLNQLVR